MPRFVILEHDHPVLHWDLMLEADGVLQTWRLAQPPALACVIDASAIDDHRLFYLEFFDEAVLVLRRRIASAHIGSVELRCRVDRVRG